MKITIISVGKIKESYLLEGIKEYIKRLSKYTKIEEITLIDEPIKDNASAAMEMEIKRIEGQRIINAIPDKAYVIALDLAGKMLTSEELAEKIIEIQNYNSSHIVFIIGGSLGLHLDVIERANFKLCFSKMTFPHKLMKLILLEQVYRAFKINNNETYHK
ncbi:MAG: 23S rRNA (pseudouridine(1915)-N(3))-methyltransferase RlmH [Anaeroplasmataceae bacterium]